jgi:hypothetical protein
MVSLQAGAMFRKAPLCAKVSRIRPVRHNALCLHGELFTQEEKGHDHADH